MARPMPTSALMVRILWVLAISALGAWALRHRLLTDPARPADRQASIRAFVVLWFLGAVVPLVGLLVWYFRAAV